METNINRDIYGEIEIFYCIFWYNKWELGLSGLKYITEKYFSSTKDWTGDHSPKDESSTTGPTG